MDENWIERWETGRTGWHEARGNAGLKSHWRAQAGTVLVPFCGKTPDLVWLAQQGHNVTGIELAEVAVRQFFAEQELAFTREKGAALDCYRCSDLPIMLYCGDYFDFNGAAFDALYDRGALVAVDPLRRADYVEHTNRLLRPAAEILLITLEYDQDVVPGPPFALLPDELATYWNDLERLEEKDDFDTCPPKFREAGLTDIKEVVWRSQR